MARRMIFMARLPSSPDTHFTVTFDFSLGLPPCITVSVVIANVRIVESLPKTVRVTVTLVSLSAVMVPAKY